MIDIDPLNLKNRAGSSKLCYFDAFVIHRLGITPVSALQLRLAKIHLIQSKSLSKDLFCRQVSWTGCPVTNIPQKSWRSTPLILGSALRAQSLPVCLLQYMT